MPKLLGPATRASLRELYSQTQGPSLGMRHGSRVKTRYKATHSFVSILFNSSRSAPSSRFSFFFFLLYFSKVSNIRSTTVQEPTVLVLSSNWPKVYLLMSKRIGISPFLNSLVQTLRVYKYSLTLEGHSFSLFLLISLPSTFCFLLTKNSFLHNS